MIKFILLQVMGAGLLLAAYLTGWLDVVIEADRLHVAPVFGILTVVGLWMASVRRSERALWLADLLPVLALVGTVAGVLSAVAQADMSNLDASRVQVFTGTVHSLVSNLLGMVAYVWLSLSVAVRGEGQ